MNIVEAIEILKEAKKPKYTEVTGSEWITGYTTILGIEVDKAIGVLLTAYEKEKEKNKSIDEFCRKELAFERRLQRENKEPDEFNQGRFYVSENIRKIIEEE